jgi:hypothetical protein
MGSLRRNVTISVVQWLPLAALTVLVFGTIYAAVQQAHRSAANDPQVQMATDAVNALQRGATPASLVPTNKIDIATSLAPYLVIYDANAQPVATSATLHGQAIIPPAGVFQSAAAASDQQDVLTWQPESDVRSAIVIQRYAGGYVLAGRSLKLVEERETDLEQIVGLGCVAALIVTYLATLGARLVESWLALRAR